MAAEALLKAVGIAKTAAVELVARDRNLQSCTAQIAEFNASRASYERAKAQSAAQAEQAVAQQAKAGENLRTAEAAAIGPAELAQAEALVETAKRRVAEARASADAAEARVTEAQAVEAAKHAPLQDADRTVQRLQAEIGGLSRVLQPHGGGLWPPLIDSVKVRPDYERALAAALGDDLEAPLESAAPRHWSDLGALPAMDALSASARAACPAGSSNASSTVAG